MNNDNKEIWICTNELFSSEMTHRPKRNNEKKNRKHHKRKFYLIPVVVFFLVGTIYGTSVYERRETIYYVVTQGDTLWDISRRYLGKGYKYLQIVLDNDISNPDLIYPRDTYKINVTRRYYDRFN